MVRIVTDSTCDLTKERLAELGVLCVPLTVHFGEEEYRDGVDMTNPEFYEKLRKAAEIPTTAQPTPHAFEEVFAQCLERGEDVVCVLISTELSGTAQSANIAKNTLESDRIHIVDSRTACLALGLLVEIAAQRAAEGRSAEEIAAEMESLTDRVRINAAVETLEYLKKGGRLSGTAAALGTMLNIHPLVGILGGKVVQLGKARGKKKMFESLRKMTEEEGIDDKYPVLLGHAQSMENYEQLRQACQPLTEGRTVLYGEIGSVIGTHAGPGVVAITYIKKA
ncbi:DegV family protein [Anaerotignum lactatifermentans]|uniref:DegV family protein n=1 Tax=Anaerotignum lactatifermentans TaxID=160404 RepID=A0ABS2GDA9_9FIRM|nr:DegV family protein [Anaerotignum lactatifermentans]MBM6828600.1 DegV family protein [Anaerotignum lactatifermentans]MBM6878528.1 DegV family protein [Anaerotignum lactatifermentans]MBM6950182.1 DegV family protein [Anaerotignum lactatifermentans]